MSLPGRSAWFFRGFRRYARRYVARNFHALRLDRDGPPADPAGPLVVVVNHASWWDPMTGLVLTGLFGPGRAHYALMSESGLNQYKILERMGFFGVEPGTARGGASFLRKATAILARPESALWFTPQGRFADVRERPTRFQEGLGRLMRRASGATVLPLALEYPFWNDRRPEALARFGAATVVEDGGARTAGEWNRLVETAMEAAQDSLAESSRSRDPSRFETVLEGSAGVGGVYDWGRRFKALTRGERFAREHKADA